MDTVTPTEQPRSMKQDLAQAHAEARAAARGELPSGAAPLTEPPAPTEVEAKAKEFVEEVKVAVAPTLVEEETLIRIGDKEFKTQSAAIKYAEQLEQEKLLAEAYNNGIRETLEATRPAQVQAAPAEDNFDEQFYANPRETLAKVRAEATQDALKIVDARDAEKAAWSRFSAAHPDLAGSEVEVRRILQENWDVLGKLKDEQKAMTILATKTRSYFQDIADRLKPRTELSARGGQAVSPSSHAAPSVTPQKKEEPILTMAEQMRKLKGRT